MALVKDILSGLGVLQETDVCFHLSFAENDTCLAGRPGQGWTPLKGVPGRLLWSALILSPDYLLMPQGSSYPDNMEVCVFYGHNGMDAMSLASFVGFDQVQQNVDMADIGNNLDITIGDPEAVIGRFDVSSRYGMFRSTVEAALPVTRVHDNYRILMPMDMRLILPVTGDHSFPGISLMPGDTETLDISGIPVQEVRQKWATANLAFLKLNQQESTLRHDMQRQFAMLPR